MLIPGEGRFTTLSRRKRFPKADRQ